MKPLRMFELLEPKSLKSASALLKELGGNAKIIAGGTDTMSCWSGRTYCASCYSKGIEPKTLRCFGTPKKPKALINIKGIRHLKGVKKRGKSIRVGALTTLTELMESPILNDGLIPLKGVLEGIGSVEIRNMATVGGNVFTHAPAAGLAPVLLCLKTKYIISDGTKKEEIPIEVAFSGYKKTGALPRLSGGRILVEVDIPRPKPGSGFGYEKTTTMKSSLSTPIASAAAMLQLHPKQKTIEDCRIYVGSCTFHPHHSKKAEKFLISKRFEPDVLNNAADLATDKLRPISDPHGSDEYRMWVARAMVLRALEKSGQMALSTLSELA